MPSYETFRKPLEEIFEACETLLNREWPWRRVGTEENLMCVKGLHHVMPATYRSIVYLLTPKRRDGSSNPGWRPEHALAVAPLIRTIVDTDVNVVIFFDGSPAGRIEHYRRAGWRDAQSEFGIYKKRFGSRPDYAAYIQERMKFLDGWGRELERDLNLTRQELENTKFWPHPGKVMRSDFHLDPPLSQDRLDFLRTILTWFYRSLSSASHLSWLGMRDRSWYYFTPRSKRENEMENFISRQIATAGTALMIYLSELQIGMAYSDLAPLVRSAWGALYPHWPDAAAVYDLRYAAAFGKLP